MPDIPHDSRQSAQAPFHLSLHVTDLAASRTFYGEILGCQEGRSTDQWVDFDFFGNQLSLHLGTPTSTTLTGKVESVAVPMPHFGAVLEVREWQRLADRLAQHPHYLIMPPADRNAAAAGAQHTFFWQDPSGNAIEFKAMQDGAGLFDV